MKLANTVGFRLAGVRRHQRRGARYLCTAGPGYDRPTGLGTPNGASAFGQ